MYGFTKTGPKLRGDWDEATKLSSIQLFFARVLANHSKMINQTGIHRNRYKTLQHTFFQEAAILDRISSGGVFKINWGQ